MSLIVEDGTKVAGAESYVSLLDAETYHAKYGNTTWTNTDDDDAKEAALRKATMYLDGHYRTRWKGRKTDPFGQSLEWPRIGVKVAEYENLFLYGYATEQAPVDGPEYFGYLDLDTIPERLKQAQMELALRALSGPLAADGDASVKSEKVDVIEITYNTGMVKGRMTYPEIDALLSDFIESTGSMSISRS